MVVLLLLNACRGVPSRDTPEEDWGAYQVRAETLAAVPGWSLNARISLDDGQDGGSGKLRWSVDGPDSELDFHAAMGRGAWHLEISPDGAYLKEANGSEQVASGVDELIQERMGWPVPVDYLQWWVRGLTAPTEIEEQQIDQDGVLTMLIQSGWRVEYKRYQSVSGQFLPASLEARRDNYRVKMAISGWQLDLSHEPDQ